jgi:lipopolysaccharide/colanic/teichoic acid biosynthesis glycosyltransferase
MSDPLPALLQPPAHVDLRETQQRGVRLVCKRALDLVLASVALGVAGPVILLAAAAVRLTSPGPAVHRQVRVGRGGSPFTLYKLRSMVVDADPLLHQAYMHELLRSATQPATGTFKLEDDPRVTRVGRWLRRTSIDELPQLWNVLRGEMSLVGPRPDLPYDLADYEDWHWRRFSVLPGISGLWQVSGRCCLPPREMLRLDVEYAETWSLRGDIRILLRTVPAVITRVGAG